MDCPVNEHLPYYFFHDLSVGEIATWIQAKTTIPAPSLTVKPVLRLPANEKKKISKIYGRYNRGWGG